MGWRVMIASDDKTDGIGKRMRGWIKRNVFDDRNPVVPKGKQEALDDAVSEPDAGQVKEKEQGLDEVLPPKEAGFKRAARKRMSA